MVGTALASRYRILQPLGEGGMGRVFEAVDEQLGRHVAVKLLRDEVNDDDSRRRFFREARAAAALSHPNACQLFEAAEHEAQPFLVMELLEGESLSARLARGPLTKEEAIDLLLPLMDALSALHRAGMVHRDLKPSNVFLTPQGVKLLDFGLARRTERSDSATASALTVPGAVTGTMRYMAPEQITGDPVDGRTDIFALGVMLFEMVTGANPFDATTNLDWLQAVLRDDPPALEDPALAPIDPIVRRALQRRPAERYDDVEGMAAALRAVIAGETAAPAAAPTPDVRETRNGNQPTLAVLPFRVLQAADGIDVLEHSVPEALTALLSEGGEWRVLSSRVGQPFAETPDLIKVGTDLHADRLVTGSILCAGEDVRVTAQLVDAKDGAICWSQASEHALTSVIALQTDIADQLIAGLREHLAAPAPARP